MLIGISFGLLACALWGVTYLLPLILVGYDPVYIAIARAVVMGACSVIGLWFQRELLKKLKRSDWSFAVILSLIGNLIQPWFIFLSVEYGGAVLAGMCFGLVPICVALVANERDRRRGKPSLALKKLALPLLAIFVGLLLANGSELVYTLSQGNSAQNFFIGLCFGLASTAMWTWYPIKNADWLLEHPDTDPVFWTSVQCVVLFPIGIVMWIVATMFLGNMPGVLGDKPLLFAGWMLFAGIACSWGAAALWNKMSQLVPTSLVGQMLVFETVFSVFFAHLWNWKVPDINLVIGISLMIGGICYSLRLFDQLQNSGKH